MTRGIDLPSLARPRKRSVTVAGHATSLSLEDAFWRELKAAAAARGTSVNALLTDIDAERTAGGHAAPPVALSAAVRVWLLHWRGEPTRPPSAAPSTDRE